MNRQHSWPLLAAFLFATAFLPHQMQAAINPATVQKLVASDGAANDSFGSSVSLSADGNTALIDASRNDSKGSAYIFIKNADGRWSQQAKLSPKYERAGKRHVSSVALSADGNTALIGCTYLRSSGQIAEFYLAAVSVFVKNADGRWNQQAKLTGENSNEGGFGDDIALSADGSTALIASSSGLVSYSTYFFIRSTDGTWEKQFKIKDLGGSVSLSANGETALIGRGVYVRGTDGKWSMQAWLDNGDESAISLWSYAVSLSGDGDTVLIGENDGLKVPAAYIFVKGTDDKWNRTAKLTPPDWAAEDSFGKNVSLSADGRTALIGAPFNDDKGENSGAAYIFAKGTDGKWRKQVKLTAVDGANFHLFGYYNGSLSADGGTVLIGAPFHDDKGKHSGAAYVYSSTTAAQP